MTYKEAVDYLITSAPMFQNVGAGAYKEGLGNTLLLDEYFSHPHRRYHTIHVAGTNGKGSCSHTIASILQHSQREGGRQPRIGLYTSPHLVDFRERIRVNGVPITEEYVVDFVEKIRREFGERIERGELGFSFFELATAMAFSYFADLGVDVAVIEVGLGGRLDCTNIIAPILSLITNISFDHTQFLGDTLAKIAYEKAGIIKGGVPVVIGETTTETHPVFLNQAHDVEAPIIFAEEQPVADIDIKPELQGYCQEKNTRTILAATGILIKTHPELGITEQSIKEGFATVCQTTGLMGRWQRLGDSPLVVCDTGHNTGGWQYLSKQILDVACQQRHIVFGCVGDKDVSKIFSLIAEVVSGKEATTNFYFCKPTVSRGRDAEEVREIAAQYGLNGEAFATVKEAYSAAQEKASSEDFIFVGGSTFVVADLLSDAF